MEEKKQLGEKLGEFFAGKGFYIVLLLCAGLIATSIWLMADGSGADVETTGRGNVGASSVAEDKSETEGALPAMTAPRTPRPTAVPTDVPEPESASVMEAVDAPAAAVETMAEEIPAVDYFIWPVNGTLLRACSMETLSYDATMADWRVHTGWDIAAPLGEPVLAAANGRVASVTVSEDLGTVVEVGHSNGLTSVYANLEDACPVSAGQIVRVGSVLGAVGTSARAESAEESHLHFALRRNGEVVDPADWLPQP